MRANPAPGRPGNPVVSSILAKSGRIVGGKRISDEDAALFRRAARGTRRIPEIAETWDTAPETIRVPASAPHRPERAQPDSSRGGSGSRVPDSPTDSDSALTYLGAGQQQRILRRLRRGQIPIEGEIDLHGLRVRDAETAVHEFIDGCRARGQACVLIIHGKGIMGVSGVRESARPAPLRSSVGTWLRSRHGVLAFCPARSQDGGTGALYVLLSR